MQGKLVNLSATDQLPVTMATPAVMSQFWSFVDKQSTQILYLDSLSNWNVASNSQDATEQICKDIWFI